MRASQAALLTLACPLLGGCGLVFGISSGELDPDPFGTADAGALGDDGGASAPPVDAGGVADAPAAEGGEGDAPADAAPSDAGPPPCDPLLLDDLEDGDGNILRCGGRSGSWYTKNDGLPGTQVPAPTDHFLPVKPGYASAYCAHTSGTGFTSGGAQMGFTLVTLPTGARGQYDLSAYTGVTFWAKAGTNGFKMYVNFPDRNTDPAGGVCTPGGAIACNDTYGKGMSVGTTWSKVTVPFSILGRDADGGPGFDKAHVYAIEFHAAPTEMPFEMWVDDVALYK